MCIYVVSSFTLQDIETILRTPSKYPLRPPNEADVIYRNLRPQYYNNIGMVNENGQNWHFLRSRLTPPLTSPLVPCPSGRVTLGTKAAEGFVCLHIYIYMSDREGPQTHTYICRSQPLARYAGNPVRLYTHISACLPVRLPA